MFDTQYPEMVINNCTSSGAKNIQNFMFRQVHTWTGINVLKLPETSGNRLQDASMIISLLLTYDMEWTKDIKVDIEEQNTSKAVVAM